MQNFNLVNYGYNVKLLKKNILNDFPFNLYVHSESLMYSETDNDLYLKLFKFLFDLNTNPIQGYIFTKDVFKEKIGNLSNSGRFKSTAKSS